MDTWESSPVLNITSRMEVMSQASQGCLILCAKSTWNVDVEGAPISQRTPRSSGFLSTSSCPSLTRHKPRGHPAAGVRVRPATWALIAATWEAEPNTGATFLRTGVWLP